MKISLSDLETSRRTIEKEQEEIAAYKKEIEAFKTAGCSKNRKSIEEQRDRILAVKQMKKQMQSCEKRKKLLTRRFAISTNSERKIFPPPKWKKNGNVCARRSKILPLLLH